ncbi:DUF5989 family protein [Tistrella sp.]|uniref:DUF5989 family protein n=1 Tax=Tistrella sp. TaxID=2024861 RepID=UPI0025FDFA13|nr:DUF5989 family protein [Tistrella sp.]|tara:strand:+ start:1067 stop:1219 length:153 start_codon:yes stop_codon:yes gene_type:complete
MGSLIQVLRLLFLPRMRLVLIPFVLVLPGFAVVLVAAQGTEWSSFMYAVF